MSVAAAPTLDFAVPVGSPPSRAERRWRPRRTAPGSRWRLLLVLLAALALACRGEIDPITGQQSATTGYPNYGPAPGAGVAKGVKASSQRRDKMSGRSQAQRGKRRLLAAMFGDDGDGGPKAGYVLARRSPGRRRTDTRNRPRTAAAALAHHHRPVLGLQV